MGSITIRVSMHTAVMFFVYETIENMLKPDDCSQNRGSPSQDKSSWALRYSTIMILSIGQAGLGKQCRPRSD